ncbi:MAG TPA: alkaline phosphatase D family protein [Polyangiaceae bacterium]|nr:alkaline phosphatase D family protein [Polyangiaceae bacterium]
MLASVLVRALAFVPLLAVACGRDAALPGAPVPASVRVAGRPVLALSAGDVTGDRAIVWARTDGYAALHVVVDGGGRSFTGTSWAVAGHDYAAKVRFTGLSPGGTFSYVAWFSADEHAGDPPPDAARGTFHTAPASDRPVPVTFGWSGDLGGLNVCRDAKEGFPIFETLTGRDLDFFIGLGDMIYGDQPCEARGLYGQNEQIPMSVREAPTLRAFWEHWKYNQGDAGFVRFLRSTSYYAVWDDHEVVNDFSPTDAWHRFPPYTIGADLVPLGRQALFDMNPIAEETTARQYRSYRWGKHLELVILDTRSYRSEDSRPDTEEHPKTMLGAEQRAWFERVVAGSDATWKVVVSSVPISIPTGRGGSAGRDGWANYDTPAGYERELRGIFSAFRDAHVKNLLFITTDVHFATAFRYRPFEDDFLVYEVTAGPLNAMLLPTHAEDDTFHPERLFFFGPPRPPTTFDEAKGFMNWAKVTLSATGSLGVGILSALGTEVARLDVDPGAATSTSSGAEAPGSSR